MYRAGGSRLVSWIVKSPFALPVAVAVTIVAWASAFPAIKAATPDFGPGALALLRFVVASAVVLGLAVLHRVRLPVVRDLPTVLALGVFGTVIYQVALNAGERSITAGAASIVSNSTPLFTTMLAVVFLRERQRVRAWLGVVVGFAGVFLVVAGESGRQEINWGVLLVLAAALSWSIWFALQKKLLNRYRPLELTCYGVWSGTLVLLIFSPSLVKALPLATPSAILTVVYLGVAPTGIAYATWAYVLSRLPASRATTFLYLTPVVSVALSWIWLHEIPSVLTLVGGGIVLGGVTMATATRIYPLAFLRK